MADLVLDGKMDDYGINDGLVPVLDGSGYVNMMRADFSLMWDGDAQWRRDVM